MRHLYVVTHPQANHHRENTVGGGRRSPSALYGELAATAAARALRERIPDDAEVDLISSDLRRTAESVAAEFGVEPVLDDRLRESQLELVHRVYDAMDEILQRPVRHQIIVTHGGTLTLVVAHWFKVPIKFADPLNFRASPGSITTLREDDAFRNRHLTSLADTRHLTS